MSIEPHLMGGEEVLSYCMTDHWAWVCTDQRVIKYRKGSGTAEQLHDISYDEISSMSLVNTGRNDKLGGYGIFAIFAGVVIIVAAPEVAAFSLILFAVGAYLIYRWRNSEESYFKFKGSGLLQTENEIWQIDDAAADDPDEVREFVRTVRSRL